MTRVKNYRANHELRSQHRAPWSNLKYYIARGARDLSAACALLDWLLLVRLILLLFPIIRFAVAVAVIFVSIAT